jgi:hypothetical protein
VFVPGKSPVKMQPKILDIFSLGELHIVYMDWKARFSSCGECYMDQLGCVSFILNFLNHFWVASRSVCSLCEAMAGSLYVATTAVS